MKAQRRGSGRLSRRASLFIALLQLSLGFMALGVSLTPVGAEPEPVELKATITDAVVQAYDGMWFNELFGKPASPIEVRNVTTKGDFTAKEDLLHGDRDFVISGTPLSAEERASAGAKSFVEIPISVTGMAVAMRAPYPSGWQLRELLPEPDEEGNPQYLDTPYAGRVVMPAGVLLEQIFRAQPLPLQAAWRTAMGNLNFRVDGGAGAPVIIRSDPGALNVYVQSYLRTFAKAAWERELTGNGRPADLVDEHWPISGPESRSGDANITAMLVDTKTPYGPSVNGHMTLLTYGSFRRAVTANPTVDVRATHLTNAAGNYVAPTKATIEAGIKAGLKTEGGKVIFTPNAALTDKEAKDAYPLTWVNTLIAPTEGLSIDKTNALAAATRYMVTAGQAAFDAVDEPRLPTELVTVAMQRIEELVKSNCTAAGGVVEKRAGGGPFDAAQLPATLSINFCVPKPPAASTSATTVASTSATTVASTTTSASTTVPGSSSTSLAPVTTEPPPVFVPVPAGQPRTATPITTARSASGTGVAASQTTTTNAGSPSTLGSSTTRTGASTAPVASDGSAPASLPLGEPHHSRAQFDKIGTMLGGGAGLFAGLRRVMRIFGKATAA